MKFRIVGGLLLCLAMVGCAGQSKYVGAWSTSIDIGPVTSEGTTTFAPDGTFKMETKVSNPLGTLQITDAGTWKEDGKKIQLSITSQNWKPQVANPAAEAAINAMVGSAKESVKKAFDEAGSVEPTWTENSAFSVPVKGIQVTFKRKEG